MLLLTLEPRASDCRVELDGVDITHRLRRIELDAPAGGATIVRLTLIDSVSIAGEAGRVEFIHRERTNGTT